MADKTRKIDHRYFVVDEFTVGRTETQRGDFDSYDGTVNTTSVVWWIETRGQRSPASVPIKQLHSVGTLVQLTVTPQDEKLSVTLKYESSRFNGEGTDSSPPDILSAKLDTAVLIPVDQMALIGSTDSKAGTILLMKVTK